jgi:hypothetical protein
MYIAKRPVCTRCSDLLDAGKTPPQNKSTETKAGKNDKAKGSTA